MNNYKHLKDQIAKLQNTNESLVKEVSDLKLMYSVNQEKLKEYLNKLESNDRELIASLTENKRLSRFNQDLQQENLMLTKNLKDSETKNRDFFTELTEKRNIVNHLQEQMMINSNQNESFKAKTTHLESQIDENERFLHQMKQNEQIVLKLAMDFQQEMEYSIKSAQNFFLNLTPDLKILLKKSLEFIVKTQDFFSSKSRENPDSLIKTFRNSIDLLLSSLEEALEDLNKQSEISTKGNKNIEILEREVKRLNREEIFNKDKEKELIREVENLKEAKNLVEREKEKLFNE